MERGLKPMDAEQLRENAHKMVDFIADYYKNIEDFPVLSQVQPGYLRELLPETAPKEPESLKDVLDDVKEKIFPGVTHWQSPGFFGYYPSNSSIAGFLGEMLSAGINIVGFSWITSPVATELEMIVLDWLAKLLNLPHDFHSTGEGGGVIQGTASEAVLVALLAARDKVLKKSGKDALRKLVVYASDQTHSAVQKACQIAGIHQENCRFLKADGANDYALSPETLSEAVSLDLANGLIPTFLCATVGTTSSTAVDPLPALGKITKSNDIWFHVDAAYAGSACICPEFRHYLNGVEEADSFNMNAHKWFLTNFDCSALWVKDKSALIQSLSTNPEFLKNKIFYVLDPNLQPLSEPKPDDTEEIKAARKKRKDDELVCREHILNTLSDRLYDLFIETTSPREIWTALEAKYKTEKASEANMVVDYKDWQIPLGRRFRSLKLWMVLRLYGLENLQAYIRNHIELARQFEELVSQDPRFEVVAPRKFALVCFRLVAPHTDEILVNKLNRDLLDGVNSSGKLFMSHTVLSGKYTLRFAVGAPLTEERHVKEAWEVLKERASALLQSV